MVGSDASCTFLSIGNGNDDLARYFLAALVFALLFEEAESESSFSGRTTLRDVDDTEFAAFEIFAEFVEIVFADVVTSKENHGIRTVVGEPLKLVAECFDHGACTEVRTTNAGYDDGVAVFAQSLCASLDFSQEFGSDA